MSQRTQFTSHTLLCSSAAAVLALTLLVACDERATEPLPPPGNQPDRVEQIDLRQATFRIGQGDSASVQPRLVGRNGRELTGRTVRYTIDDSLVASIDSTGRLLAKGSGITTLRAASEGVSASARIEVLPATRVHALMRQDGRDIPLLIGSDSVEWDGVPEYHEVWLESGRLKFIAGAQPRYEVELRYVEYNVRDVNGRREKQFRLVQREADFGTVQLDAEGALRMTSEFVWPLEHRATRTADGYSLRYRVAGTNDVLTLSYRAGP
jgi:hypothetical protein